TGISYGWTGDVKYHLGADRQLQDAETKSARITLANNPSHLEFINPIVEGSTRAAQETRTQKGYPVQDETKSLAILIHGD
ncbi:thiamine pyrophosphate-dependent enzyme, partial [Bacillus tropicus]